MLFSTLAIEAKSQSSLLVCYQVLEMAKQLMDSSSDHCQVMKKLKNVLSCGTAIIDAFIKYVVTLSESQILTLDMHS